MPVIDPEENRNFILDSIPGLRERLEEESQNLFGNPDPLSLNEQQRLQTLVQQNRRNQPLDARNFTQPGSQRIFGNPFSIDTRSSAGGLRDLGFGLINRFRRRRREEIAPELSNLTERAEKAEQVGQQSREFTSDLLREAVLEKLKEERESNLFSQENQARKERDDREFEQAKTLKQVDNDLKKEFETFKQGLQNNNSNNRPPSLTTGLANRISDAARARRDEISRLRDIKAGDFFDPGLFPDIDDEITRLENEERQLRQLTAQPFRTNADVDNLIDSFESIVGGEPANGDQGDNDDVVSPGELEDFAQRHTGGDITSAKRILENRGFTIEE